MSTRRGRETPNDLVVDARSVASDPAKLPSGARGGHRQLALGDRAGLAAGTTGVLGQECGRNGTQLVRDAATREPLRTYTGHTGPVNTVAFSPDSARIASGSDDQTVHIWEAVTGRLLLPPLKGHDGEVLSVAFQGDAEQSLIASASADRTIKLWDAATGRPVAELIGHEGAVRSVAFDPHGTRLATASDDKTVRIWDIGSRQEEHRLTRHSDEVWCAAFSRDGERLASVGKDGRLHVWNAETGDELLSL